MMELGSVFQQQPRPAWGSPSRAPRGRVVEDGLWEAIEAREVVERALARLAAYRRTDRDLVRLDAALALMRSAGNSREAFNAGDFAFHVVLSDAAHNRVLAGRLAVLHDRVREMIALYTETAFREGRVDVLLDAHVRLVDAVVRQDADEAPSIMSEMMARLHEEAGAVADVQFDQSTAGPRARQSKGERP